MTNSAEVETIARAMYASDPRVNQKAWVDADVNVHDIYRIMASLGLAVRTRR
jgi:hypothetical protein